MLKNSSSDDIQIALLAVVKNELAISSSLDEAKQRISFMETFLSTLRQVKKRQLQIVSELQKPPNPSAK